MQLLAIAALEVWRIRISVITRFSLKNNLGNDVGLENQQVSPLHLSAVGFLKVHRYF
jgi:hypothetical protein